MRPASDLVWILIAAASCGAGPSEAVAASGEECAMNPINWLDGYKTYLSALGLLGLAVYQASEGAYQLALQSFLAALAAFGLRQAVAKAAKRDPDCIRDV